MNPCKDFVKTPAGCIYDMFQLWENMNLKFSAHACFSSALPGLCRWRTLANVASSIARYFDVESVKTKSVSGPGVGVGTTRAGSQTCPSSTSKVRKSTFQFQLLQRGAHCAKYRGAHGTVLAGSSTIGILCLPLTIMQIPFQGDMKIDLG